MESKLYKAPDQQMTSIGLLPYYFKIVGIVLILLAFLPAIVVKAGHIEMAQAQKELLRTLTLDAFILGLLFIAWARDKVEDELTIALRLKSMGMAFIWAVLFVVLEPLAAVIVSGYAEYKSAQGLVISMLLGYLLLYYLQKKAR